MTDSNFDAERLIALLSGRTLALDTLAESDWQRIIELAQKQSVAPMLYSWLRARRVTPTPRAAQQLRDIYLSAIKRNSRLFHELGQVLSALQTTGIPVIPLKGACLAEAVYVNFALRQMVDMDLLVKPTDLEKAVDVLRKIGYEAEYPFEIELERQVYKDMPHLSKHGGFTLELHWSIASPRYNVRMGKKDLDQLWLRATPATIGGIQVLMLSPTDLLLHLCLHASVHHRFDGIGLGNFWDMALVLRRYGDTCWEQFTARAHEWGIANGTYLTLQLVEEWTGVNIPKPVMRALMPATLDNATIEWVRHKIWNGISPDLQSGDFARLGKPRFIDRLSAMRDTLFQPRVSMASMYHLPADSWRIPCYYPVRLKDLLMRYSQVMWKFLCGDKTLTEEVQQEAHLREYLGWN